MMISIIIPVINEGKIIGKQLDYLVNIIKNRKAEILVIDGGSDDNTVEIAKIRPIKVYISSKNGRANQMNYGASLSKGDILYFVHIDTIPPNSFLDDILYGITQGFKIGTYRQKFNSSHPLLKINAFFTRFDYTWCRGGDQTFYIERNLFNKMDGYNQDFVIMEEYDFLNRVRAQEKLLIIPKSVITSARKYESNSYWKVLWANFYAFRSFKKGVKTEIIAGQYKKYLNY